MKNMTNKEIYDFLHKASKNNFAGKKYLEENYFNHKFNPFKEERNGETIYGFLSDEFFNLNAFKINLAWPYFWVQILFYIFLWSVVIIGIQYFYVSGEFYRMDKWSKIISIVIGLIFIGGLIKHFPNFLNTFGSCTSVHRYKVNGEKEVEILGRYSDSGHRYNFL